ncbi:MAG TPA: hypothetical protein VED37_01920, partial [Ktedonobacteraceae bacterium]|nr:hypothetical protein [Ktedonobacteraceae bacterium]
EAISLPMASYSFPEYSRFDSVSALVSISQQSHLSRTPPIHRPWLAYTKSLIILEKPFIL